ETYLKQAIALDGNLPGPYEGLGFVEMRRNQYSKALDYFKQAATRGSKNYLTHYYYADALQREMRDHLSTAIVKKITDELQIAIRLRPQFAESYYMLGYIALMSGESLKEGADAMQVV